MTEKTLIQKIVYWFFITSLPIITLKVFGNPELNSNCRDTVSAIKDISHIKSLNQRAMSYFGNIERTVLLSFNRERRSQVATARIGVFIYGDKTGVEQNDVLQRTFNSRLKSTVVSHISFFIVHDQRSAEDMVNLLNQTKPSVRLIHWDKIGVKNKNRNFANHFQKALDQKIPSVFVILKSDFRKILSSLSTSEYSNIVEHTSDVYLPSLQFFHKRDDAKIFDFVKLIHKTSFVLVVFFKQTKTPAVKQAHGNMERRAVVMYKNPHVVSDKPYYPYLEALQVLKDHDVHSWTSYHKLRTEGNLPKALPKNPEAYYKKEWKGENAFFDRKEVYTYKEAMVIMEEYGIHTLAEYHVIRRLDELPKVLPANPQREYGRKWDHREFFNKPKKPLESQYY